MSDGDSRAGLSSTKRALRALQELRVRLDAVEAGRTEAIAIVGMGCRFPGAPGLDEYWKLMVDGIDAVGEVPPDRWAIEAFYDPDPSRPGKTFGRWGGFLDGLDHFDAAFFGISAREAPHVDPRQRLVLEVAWEALSDAGIAPFALAGSATGVFFAVLTNDYDQLLAADPRRFEVYTGTGVANAIVANRLSYFLDLRGPSVVLDTACSGSLVALDMACRSILTGACSMAITGGVSVNLLPAGDIFFAKAGSLSPAGRCRAFDVSSSGMVRAEGIGVLVLKRLSTAIDDGDRIYAVIRGSAVNHDGRSNGIMAPNGQAQEAVLRDAYARAGVSPASVQYIEAHGTGTRVGDPVEVRALGAVLSVDRPPGHACVLGSVKTNIGHTEAAAGVAGVIKVALAMHHRLLPGTLHFEEWNPLIPYREHQFEVRTRTGPWPAGQSPLFAGVSGFGFGGTNAHIVLAEAPPAREPATVGSGPLVLPLSASSSAALVASAAQFATYLDSGHTPLDDVCFTAAVRRSHLEHRAAVVGSSREELATACRELAEAGQIGASRPHRVVFAFSGQSPVWEGMGRELLASVPAFKDAVEACDAVFEPLAGWSLMDRLHREGRSADLEQIDVAQPMIFAFQIGVAAVWKAWGITPDIVFGQSMGEVAAACVAGWLDLTDAARVIYHRSRLLRSTSGRGRTAVIGLGPAQARLALAGFDGVLSVAGSTSSTATAISGEPAALDELLARLAAQEVFCRRLNNVDTAAHSPQMDSLKPQLEAELAGIAPRAGEVAFMSTVTADYVDGCPLDGTYWANNLREPFRVGEAVQRLLQEGVCAFVEISPQPVLLTALRQSIAEISRDSVAVASTNRDAGELEALLRSLCELYGAGCDPDWRAVIGREGRCVSLPPYPWQRERYWYDQLDRDQGAKSGTRPVEGAHPLLGVEFASALPSGEQFREVSLSVDSLHYLRDHAVGGVAVLPAAAYLEMALAVCGIERVLEDVRFEQVLTLPEGEARRLQFVLRPGSRTADFQVYSRSATGPSTWVLHSAGTAGIAPGGEGGSVAALYALVRSRGSTGPLSPIHPDEHYRAMQSRGLVYGESFRSIRELWRGDACAVVRVELAADTFSDAYCIHPALLDGCFQAVAAAAPDDGGTLYGTGVYLPSGVRHLRLTRHAPASVWCAVQMSGPTGGPRLEADLALFADDGALVADIRGLELRRLDAAADDKPGYYAVDWLERHLQGEVTTGRWLLVGDGEGLATELSERLEARGCQWRKLEVHSGGVEEALGGVLGETNWDGVAFLHGVGCTGESVAGVLSTLLATVRAIASQASPGKPRLFVVTRGAQLVAGTERDGAVAEACLWGFGRALAVEHPEFWGGLVDLGGDDADGESLCGELLASDGEDQVGYRSGRRYVARLVRSRLQGSRPLRIRTDGAYLVTGGLSGLGLEAARWLAGRGARRLILVGRTGMPTREEWNGLDASSRLGLAAAGIRELERTGAAVHTAAVDVGREGALQSYVESYRAKGYPPIVGIVHAAGVLCDELAMRMSDAVLEQALAPKLYGGMEIDRIARDPSVELVVLYSSATGVLGQLGQVNYGAGNAYLDALARRRDGDRQRWLSVAWGPWAEVGLFARERLDEKAGLTGVTPLTPREGLAALVAAIESNEAEVLVVRADWSKSRRRIVSDLAAGPAPSGGDEGANASLVLELLLAEPEQRRRRLEEWLRDRVARVLRTEAARVATARPLVALGIDSLMAVELRNGIDGELGLGLALVDLFTGTIQDLAIRLDQMVESDTRLAQLRDRDRLDELLADLVPAEREVGDGEAG